MELKHNRIKIPTCLSTKKLNQHRKEIIDNFQFFDREQLRRKTVPHYQCVLEELAEEGFHSVLEYIKNLVEENEQLILSDEIGIIRRLIDVPEIIDILKDILIQADKASSEGDRVRECLALREGANRILQMKNVRGWLWVIRQLLLISLTTAQLEKLDGGFQEAYSHYTYAKFLWEHYFDQEIFNTTMDSVAMDHLSKARHLSIGMENWCVDEGNGDGKHTLYEKVCLLIRDIHIREMYILKDEEKQIAERPCILAARSALESGNKDEYGSTLTKIGNFLHYTCNKTQSAIEYFNKAYDIQKFTSNKLGYIQSTKQHLQDVLRLAEDSHIILWQGRALTSLAEEDLWQDQPKEASKKFIQAYKLFRNDILSQFQSKNTVPGVINIGHTISKSMDKNSELFKYQSDPEINVFSERSMTIRWNNSSMTARNNEDLTLKDVEDNYLSTKETAGFLVSHRLIRSKEPTVAENINDGKDFETQESVTQTDVLSERQFSDIFDQKTLSQTRRPKKHRKKKKRDSFELSDDEASNDDLRIQSDVNLPGNDYTYEMDYIRCLCGISGGQEIIQLYFDALWQAGSSESTRVDIIEWKLMRKSFWKNYVSTMSNMDKTLICFIEPFDK